MILIATAYYVTMIPISGKRPPCTHSRDWRTPARCAIPEAARRTPRQTSKNMHFVLSYCFFLFCHLCYLISAELKTISREDAHLMYPRYLRVLLYMLNDLLSTPPPNLCENGLGVSLSCTCAAFSLFAKLDWFFPKKSKTVYIWVVCVWERMREDFPPTD